MAPAWPRLWSRRWRTRSRRGPSRPAPRSTNRPRAQCRRTALAAPPRTEARFEQYALRVAPILLQVSQNVAPVIFASASRVLVLDLANPWRVSIVGYRF